MRSFPSLGCANAALVSLYFVPVWGGDALRTLTSPYNGFEDRVQATAAIYFRLCEQKRDIVSSQTGDWSSSVTIAALAGGA